MQDFTHIREIIRDSDLKKDIDARKERQAVEGLIAELCDGDKNLPSRDAITGNAFNKYMRGK